MEELIKKYEAAEKAAEDAKREKEKQAQQKKPWGGRVILYFGEKWFPRSVSCPFMKQYKSSFIPQTNLYYYFSSIF